MELIHRPQISAEFSTYFGSIESDIDFISLLAKATASALNDQCQVVESMIAKTNSFTNIVMDKNYVVNDSFVEYFASIDDLQSRLKNLVDTCVSKQRSALVDSNLQAENEILVCAHYEKTIRLWKKLFDSVESLRWVFLEKQGEEGGVADGCFETMDEMLEEIGV